MAGNYTVYEHPPWGGVVLLGWFVLSGILGGFVLWFLIGAFGRFRRITRGRSGAVIVRGTGKRERDAWFRAGYVALILLIAMLAFWSWGS